MPNEKQLTAMQALIEEIKKDRDYSLPIKKHLIIKIEKHLPTERQQLIDAYGSDRTPCSEQDAIDYFEQTFKTQ